MSAFSASLKSLSDSGLEPWLMLISGYLMRNPAATMSVNYFLKGSRFIFLGKGLTLIIGISKLLAFELPWKVPFKP